MDDSELRARLVRGPQTVDTVVIASEVTPSIDPVISAAEQVMSSYQNANKWLDSLKEYVLMKYGCVFFSNYIHNLAHTMPVRFDKFGDILHTADIVVPYPATSAIDCLPSDISTTFVKVFNILESICSSLREFIKITQDTDLHALACSTEELLVDISGEFTHLYRMRRIHNNCESDYTKFDTWVSHYVVNLNNLID